MPITTINPTRLERSIQLNREKTARRGHKLLKDKSDEMFRNLKELQVQAEKLRDEVQARMARAINLFLEGRAYMTGVEIENAINAVRSERRITARTKNIMGLIVPEIEIIKGEKDEEADEWHFNTTHQSFDSAIQSLETVLPKLVKLAALEKTCAMLENEIRLIRRRVNALEYSVIPKIRQNINTITMKLSENERGNLVRLMKVKDIIDNKG